MKTITKRLREQAALICDVEASTPDLCGNSFRTACELGYPANAWRVALDAWSAVEDATCNDTANAPKLRCFCARDSRPRAGSR